jgi:hypothetical protein
VTKNLQKKLTKSSTKALKAQTHPTSHTRCSLYRRKRKLLQKGKKNVVTRQKNRKKQLTSWCRMRNSVTESEKS